MDKQRWNRFHTIGRVRIEQATFFCAAAGCEPQGVLEPGTEANVVADDEGISYFVCGHHYRGKIDPEIYDNRRRLVHREG